MFVAGNVINLENIETKEAFIAGSTINITSSTIRNLYAAAETIKLKNLWFESPLTSPQQVAVCI